MAAEGVGRKYDYVRSNDCYPATALVNKRQTLAAQPIAVYDDLVNRYGEPASWRYADA